MVLAAFVATLSALAEDGIIRNRTVWHDAASREFWCNGGPIIQEVEVIYWVGSDTNPGRWPWRSLSPRARLPLMLASTVI